MPKVSDILRIKEEIIFGGAIQADWYYDKSGDIAAENFVFHGPSYFGVLEDEVEFTEHKLIDTCCFTNLLVKKLSTDEGNPITLSIAGYGTGKSHLAVTLAKLFSDINSTSSSVILRNMNIADSNIAQNIKTSLRKPNLCIVLNGMKDFNMNYEIINCVKKSLKEHGYSEEILAEFTKAYNIAKLFVERNYERFETEFIDKAPKYNIVTDELKLYLLENIFKDDVFELVNDIYRSINGEYIRWDEGITGAEVIKKLNDKLCGDNQPFNKIIIFFDEFGRYLEYVSVYPTRAGDAALQQIYDVVTSSENNIQLVAFIQSDLKTYLSRVNKSSNVSRYIGRYESGEKLYLSSNIETIFANIIEKYNINAFNHYVKEWFVKDEESERYCKLFDLLQNWSQNNKLKGIWSNKGKFNKVIIEGIYPFHALTTYLLMSLSDWYQQRSALQFLISSFNKIKNKDIKELGSIPQVYAIDMLKGDLFKELLLAEDEGRQKSEYCTVYDKIIAKYDEKLNEHNKDILTALLGVKLTKFRLKSKNDLLFLIENLSGYSSAIIEKNLTELEEDLGIINYDERNLTYDFVEDATGINDFNRFIRKKKADLSIPFNVMINESILEKIGISNPIKPDFTIKNNIKTSEWVFEQELIPIDNITSTYIEGFIKEFTAKTSVDKPKGRIIYVYYNSNYDISDIEKIVANYNKYKLENYPIVFVFLDDIDRYLEDSIISNTIINKFTEEEKMKFSKYILKYSNDIDEKLNNVFRDLIKDKKIVEKQGLVESSSRISIYCNNLLNNLYPDIIPFPFDGFDGKSITNAKKHYLSICNWLVSCGSVNEQGYHLLIREVKNRTEAVLKNSIIGWGVLNNEINFCYPANHKVKKIFDKLNKEMDTNNLLDLGVIYKKFIKAPYGLNDYSINLLIICFICYQQNTIKILYNGNRLKLQEWATKVLNDRGINIKELMNSSLIKVEIEGYLLKYLDLCEKIEKNNDISLFSKLSFELESLMKENDPPYELKSRVDGAKIRSEHGTKTYEKKQKEIANLSGIFISATDNNMDLSKIISNIKACNTMIEKKDEVNSFQMTGKQQKSIIDIIDKSYAFLEKNYIEYIKIQRCQNISQLTGFEKWMNSLKHDLIELGYHDFAKATDKRLREILDNVTQLKESQLVIENSDKFLKVNVPTEYTSHEELLSWNDEISRIINYIEANSYLDKYKKRDLIEKLENRKEAIQKFIKGLNEQMTEIFNKAFDISDIHECSELMSDIELVLSKKIRSKDKGDIFELGNVLQNFLGEIKDIDKEANLIIRRERVELLFEKYEEEDAINLDNVFENYIKSINNKLEELNTTWAKNNLSVSKEITRKWESNQCAKWINEWENAPYYLDENNLKLGKEILISVLERRKQLKIDSIFEIFNTLNEEEKESCLKLLMNYKE